MKLFDENGNEYNYKNIYDEDGNPIGGFLEKMGDSISDAFSKSWLLGILLFIVFPIIGIIYLICLLAFKLLILVLKILWWLIRLPFCLILYKRLPYFSKINEADYVDIDE